MALVNLREQVESGSQEGAATGGRAGARGHGQTSRRDERVVAIQKILLEHQLPVGSKDGGPDGRYGKTTNASLYRFVNASHTNPRYQNMATSIKPYVDPNDYKKTLPNISTIHAFVEGKDAPPAGEHKIPEEEREVYDLVVFPGRPDEFIFPIMAAVRSVKNLDYMMRLYRLIKDDSSPAKRAQDVRKWVLILSEHMSDPSWGGARTLLQDYGRVLEEGYQRLVNDPKEKMKNVKIVDYLKARFPIEMGKISPARYPELTSWLYSITSGRLTTNETPSALIKKPGMLSSYHPVIFKQLTEMINQQEGRRGYA